MAGIYDRMLYDGCTYTQNTVSSIKPLNYSIFTPKYENATLRDFCAVNKGATIDNGFTHHVVRTDMESDLKNITRLNSRCANQKWLPCYMTGEECKNSTVVNPYACDRDIVPTNMKHPENSGF